LHVIKINQMRKLLHILAFPFIFILSIAQAMLANPFRFRINNDGIDIGIVPILIIMYIIL
jgi:hypothetical protein